MEAQPVAQPPVGQPPEGLPPGGEPAVILFSDPSWLPVVHFDGIFLNEMHPAMWREKGRPLRLSAEFHDFCPIVHAKGGSAEIEKLKARLTKFPMEHDDDIAMKAAHHTYVHHEDDTDGEYLNFDANDAWAWVIFVMSFVPALWSYLSVFTVDERAMEYSIYAKCKEIITVITGYDGREPIDTDRLNIAPHFYDQKQLYYLVKNFNNLALEMNQRVLRDKQLYLEGRGGSARTEDELTALDVLTAQIKKLVAPSRGVEVSAGEFQLDAVPFTGDRTVQVYTGKRATWEARKDRVVGTTGGDRMGGAAGGAAGEDFSDDDERVEEDEEEEGGGSEMSLALPKADATDSTDGLRRRNLSPGEPAGLWSTGLTGYAHGDFQGGGASQPSARTTVSRTAAKKKGMVPPPKVKVERRKSVRRKSTRRKSVRRKSKRRKSGRRKSVRRKSKRRKSVRRKNY